MKHFEQKFNKPFFTGVASLLLLSNSTSAMELLLTESQLHAVLGVVTNFILEDEATENNTTITLKKTGQTQSYDTSGTVVTDGSVKDDGFYQKGVTPNYTRDNGNEIVTDHITGLQWQDDLAVTTIQKPWLETNAHDQCLGINGQTLDATQCTNTAGDTAASYCTNLVLGGHTDWRLPTAKELVGLIDYGKTNPALDTTFQHTLTSFYWSSSTYDGYIGDAWYVNFFRGYHNISSKSFGYYVRCVRVEQSEE